MAQLRKFQFLRNSTISTYASYALARTAAETAFADITTLQDGEIALFSYKLISTGETVHTLLGIKRTNGIDIVANYDELTAEYQSYVASEIEDLDVNSFSLTTLNGDKLEGYQISEVDGKIVQGQTAETLLTFTSEPTDINKVVTLTEIQALAPVAHTGDALDVTIDDEYDLYNAVNVEHALAEVMTKVNNVDAAVISVGGSEAIKVTDGTEDTTVKTVSLKIADGDLVLSQTNDGLKTTLTVDTKKYPTDTDAEGYVAEKAGKTYIQIKGIDGELIDETDAAAFVKDGFLASVTKDTITNELVFTWNTDAGKENQVTRIAISDLCDVYTADETYLLLNGYNFEHKKQEHLPKDAQGIAEAVTGTGAYEETKTFKVPQLTVDAAGHVTAINEKVVRIELPAKQVASDVAIDEISGIEASNVQGALAELQEDIDAINGVEWSGNDEIVVDNNAHTIKHKEHSFIINKTAENAAVKSVVIPQITVNDYGHVTAIENKTFTIDCNVTTVSGTDGQIVVSSTEANDDVNYNVSLAKLSQENTLAEHKFNDTEVNTTKVISNVVVDDYGRVKGVQFMTIYEDYDCGTYGETNN